MTGNGAAGKALSGAKRKKLFWSKANRAGRSFTPEHVWTICMYQVCCACACAPHLPLRLQ